MDLTLCTPDSGAMNTELSFPSPMEGNKNVPREVISPKSKLMFYPSPPQESPRPSPLQEQNLGQADLSFLICRMEIVVTPLCQAFYENFMSKSIQRVQNQCLPHSVNSTHISHGGNLYYHSHFGSLPQSSGTLSMSRQLGIRHPTFSDADSASLHQLGDSTQNMFLLIYLLGSKTQLLRLTGKTKEDETLPFSFVPGKCCSKGR